MEFENRNKIYILCDCGITDRSKISRRTSIPYSTVCAVLKRKHERLPVERMRGSGEHSVLTSIDKNRISNLANSHPKWS